MAASLLQLKIARHFHEESVREGSRRAAPGIETPSGQPHVP
jgi:hypothetical protein